MKKFTSVISVLLLLITITVRATITITGPNPTVWSTQTVTNPYLINDNIVVEDGGVLDVYVDLHFAQGYGITVKKGGLLMIREGITLTTQGNNYLWEGIIIEGTNGQKVLPIDNIVSNQGGPHGVVLIREATITNAKVGVMVGNRNNNKTGGLLQAIKALFINNGIAIEYNAFGPSTSDNNKGNANYLRKCDFIQNSNLQDVYDNQLVTKNFIKLDNYTGGLTVRGCYFNTDNITMNDVSANQIIGIYSTGGSQNILLDEATDQTVDGNFDPGRRNSFTGLYKGVFFNSTTSGSSYDVLASDFRNSDFYKVMICYHFKRSEGFAVDCNNQTVDYNNYINACSFNYEEYYQVQGIKYFQNVYYSNGFASCFVWTEECFNHHIRNNDVNWQISFAGRGVGVVSYNSISGNTQTIQVSDNTFRFDGTNEYSTNTYGCLFVGSNTETQLTCNTFIQLYRDLFLKGLIFDKTSGNGQGAYLNVLNPQGNPPNPSNNTFSDDAFAPGKMNIESDADLTYHYFGVANPTNLTYPNWRLFHGSLQAFFTPVVCSANNFICSGTDCTPFVDTKASELLRINPTLEEDAYALYPNPNTGSFTISLPENVNQYITTIYDGIGRKINNYDVENNNNNINISGLKAGLYLIKISNGRFVLYSTKIIVK